MRRLAARTAVPRVFSLLGTTWSPQTQTRQFTTPGTSCVLASFLSSPAYYQPMYTMYMKAPCMSSLPTPTVSA
ncbi:hypothetical protein F4803DRAFT_15995 [Xylaria telfairii]|nr:hypothetical protein F4803DRAFT_15995 [Xylaria telfairii]